MYRVYIVPNGDISIFNSRKTDEYTWISRLLIKLNF